MTTQQIIRLMERARALEVQTIEVDQLKITFYAKSFTPLTKAFHEPVMKQYKIETSPNRISDEPNPRPDKPEDVVKFQSPLDDLTDEEIMLYATPAFDELQAKKKDHEEKLKQEKL